MSLSWCLIIYKLLTWFNYSFTLCQLWNDFLIIPENMYFTSSLADAIMMLMLPEAGAVTASSQCHCMAAISIIQNFKCHCFFTLIGCTIRVIKQQWVDPSFNLLLVHFFSCTWNTYFIESPSIWNVLFVKLLLLHHDKNGQNGWNSQSLSVLPRIISVLYYLTYFIVYIAVSISELALDYIFCRSFEK